VEYSYGEDQFQQCISDKKYHGLKESGWLGISSGNPWDQNVNDIDVYSIDFFNMNSQFYQLSDESFDENNVAADDDVDLTHTVDENGFLGNRQYPESSKLNTIKMGRVAFDIFEYKRLKNEFKKEQFKKSLNIIKK